MPPFRQVADDGFDVRQKTHVKHAVRFIEDEHFQRAEIDFPASDEIDQAPRRGDDDVDALLQGLDLRGLIDSAEDGRDADRQIRARRPGCFP